MLSPIVKGRYLLIIMPRSPVTPAFDVVFEITIFLPNVLFKGIQLRIYLAFSHHFITIRT